MKQNPVPWFEVPTKDIKRAIKFYESLLDIKLEKANYEYSEMYMFPGHEGNVMGAMGALIYHKDAKPSQDGVLIYFSTSDIDDTLSRVEKLGGKIVLPKKDIGKNGYYATIIDSEGNKVAIHMEK